MRIERVVDPALLLREGDGKAELRRALADHRAPCPELLRARSVFLRDMLDELLPLGRQVRIELERLEADVRFDEVANARQRFLKPFEADDAPRAGNIGNEVDGDGSGHLGTALGEGRNAI